MAPGTERWSGRWPWPAQRSVESIWEAVRRDVDGVAGFLMREFAFMLDEVERENPGQLDALSAWLADRLEELGIVRALRLSKIRVLDSLVWFDWNRIDKKKTIFSGYGWLRHPETRQVYYDGEPTALTRRLVEAWQPAGLTPVLALVESSSSPINTMNRGSASIPMPKQPWRGKTTPSGPPS